MMNYLVHIRPVLRFILLPAIWFPRQIKYDCFLYGMEMGLFSNTIIKSIVKHHVLLKWNKYTAMAGDDHVYLKGKRFVDTPSKLYLIILIFI